MEEGKATARLVRFLARGPATVEPSARGDAVVMRSGDGAHLVDRQLLRELLRSGAVLAEGERIALAAGAKRGIAKAVAASGDAVRAQHRDLASRRMEVAGSFDDVTVNLSESPLAQLARYRLRDGNPFLTTGEFDAGERLRADYTRGRIMPRLGANWEASVTRGRRGAGAGTDITDDALAARQRVDAALFAVGPELAGVLVDICCFLKGLERVESERLWPVRSAKVVLKTALGALERHYQPVAVKRRPAQMLHWGAQDYRPRIQPS